MNSLHWSYILPSPGDDSFYRQFGHIPPPYSLPEGYECNIFTFPWDEIPSSVEYDVLTFVNTHNQVGKYNFARINTETLNRFKKTGSCLAILMHDSKIIGTMISLGFRCSYIEREIYTSYTTFLCVHKNYRSNGLAMILIQSIMRHGQKYNIHSGYYLSDEPHQPIKSRNVIRGWYRPINHQRVRNLGYSLPNLPPSKDIERKYRLMYHIPKSDIVNRIKSPGIDEWRKAMYFFNSDTLHLIPTEEEFRWYCSFFDVYLFKNGILMVIPLSIMISSTRKIANNLYVAYMSTNLLPEALCIAKEGNYDLLTGFYVGEITEDRVDKVKGHTTIAPTHLEFYNTSDNVKIPPESFILPIF